MREQKPRTALLYYDFALTMPLEVKHFWGRRLSWPSALFFLNRYFSVVSHVPIVYKDFGNPSKLVRSMNSSAVT